MGRTKDGSVPETKCDVDAQEDSVHHSYPGDVWKEEHLHHVFETVVELCPIWLDDEDAETTNESAWREVDGFDIAWGVGCHLSLNRTLFRCRTV